MIFLVSRYGDKVRNDIAILLQLVRLNQLALTTTRVIRPTVAGSRRKVRTGSTVYRSGFLLKINGMTDCRERQLRKSLTAVLNMHLHHTLVAGTHRMQQLVSWSLTSLFSTNMAISETKGQGWKVICTQ